MTSIDRAVEQASRWTASRFTRRSFVGRMGKIAVLVAGGPALATVMADGAEARACGQTGVSPPCPTFDCDGVWGWCWYATSCCAGNLLKKICDCCAYQWPNVHGYCPPGHNVRCMVESCDEDPRVQRAAIRFVRTDHRGEILDAINATRFPAGSRTVVVGDGDDWLSRAVAGALAGMLRAALLLASRTGPTPELLARLDTLAPVEALVAGPSLPASIDDALYGRGIGVGRVGTARDVATFSGEVAQWARDRLGPRHAVAVEPHGLSFAAAPLAAAMAGAVGFPLIIGATTPRSGRGLYLVGPEAAVRAPELPGAAVLGGRSMPELALQLATAAVSEGLAPGDVVLTPIGSVTIPILPAAGRPILLHHPGVLAPVQEFLSTTRSTFTGALAVGAEGALGTTGLRALQSSLNGFLIERLIGVGGQGLPVYAQPLAEREMGAARRGSDPPPGR